MQFIRQLTAALLLFCGGAAALRAQAVATVRFTVDSVADNRALMVLPGATHRQELPLLTDTLRSGHVTLSIPAEAEPRMFWIQLQGVMHPLKLMLQGTCEVDVHTYVDANIHGGVSFPRFGKTKVSGSPIHDEYVARNVNRDSIARVSARIEKEYQDIVQTFGRPASPETEALTKTERFQAFMQARKAFQEAQTQAYNECFRRHGDSWWGPLLMLDNMVMLRPMEKEIFDTWPQEVKDTYYGRLLQQAFERTGEHGAGEGGRIMLPQPKERE